MKKLLLSLFCLLAMAATASAQDALYTCLFGPSYNSAKVGSYSGKFTAKNNGHSWTVQNFNNNNNGWDYVRCGSKSTASVGIITTDFAAPEKIDKVVMTVDNVTTKSINSIKLYSSPDNSTWTEVCNASTIAAGEITLEIDNPIRDLYYKLEVDCAKGSNNGFFQLSKLEYFGIDSDKELPTLSFSETTFSVPQGGTFEAPELYNPENLSISWNSSDKTVATVSNDGSVTIIGTGTTVITATSVETADFAQRSVSYTLNVLQAAKSIAEFMELGKDDKTLKIVVDFDLTVGFANYGNIYATDGTDWIQIYKQGNQTPYELNDVFEKGWIATYTLYSNTTPEIMPVGDLTLAATKGNITLQEYTADQLTTEMVNTVVVVKDLTFEDATPSTKTSWTVDNLALYNKFTVESVEAGKYNVTGVVEIYNNAPQLSVVSYEAVAAEKQDVTLAFPEATVTIDENEDSDYFLDPAVLTPAVENAVITYSAVEETSGEGATCFFDQIENKVYLSVEPGTYVITASFEGNDQYNPATATCKVVIEGTVVIEKKNATLAFPETTYALEANTEGVYLIAPATLTPAIENAVISYSAVEEGTDNTVTCTFDADQNMVSITAQPGTYTVTASFEGNDEFNPATATCKVVIEGTVVIEKKNATLAFPEATVTIDENEDGDYFLNPAVLTPAVENAVITYSAVEETSGEGATCFFDQIENKVYLSVEPGTYVITASFEGNDQYNPATATCKVVIEGTVVIEKKNATLAFPETAYALEANTEGVYLIAPAALTPAIENAVISYSAVEEGTDNTVTCTFDADQNMVSITAQPGTYTMTASFEGNDEFNPATGTCVVVISEQPIVKQDVTLAFEKDTYSFYENDTMEYTVKGVTATPASESITVEYTCHQVLADNDIDFLFYDKDTNEVSMVLSPGTYVLTAKFAGNDLFNAAETQTTVRVTPKQPEVPVATVTVNNTPVETAETIELPNKASFADITLTTTLPATTILYNITKEGEENNQMYSVYKASEGISINYACTVTYFSTRYEQQSERKSITFTMASSGIEAILAADPEAQIYNLKGERVYGEPADGLYIVVSNGKATKTMIKK